MELISKKTEIARYERYISLPILFIPVYLAISAAHLFPAKKSDPVSLDLDSAIRIAETNYFALKAIKNKSIAIRELITERWRDYLPSVGTGYFRQKYIIEDGQDAISNEIRLNIEQVIYDGGKRGFDLDLAELESLLTKEDFRLTHDRLLSDVRKSFFSTLGASGKIAMCEVSLERARLHLDLAKLELQNGFITKIQLLQIASKVQELELMLMRSRHELIRSKSNLKLSMNLDPGFDIQLTDSILRDYIIQEPALETGNLISNVLSKRPEYSVPGQICTRLKWKNRWQKIPGYRGFHSVDISEKWEGLFLLGKIAGD
ncbi:MAG: TolC family protein [Leptospira sp.]|nr:TolC family protein [Leptospira sp.]